MPETGKEIPWYPGFDHGYQAALWNTDAAWSPHPWWSCSYLLISILFLVPKGWFQQQAVPCISSEGTVLCPCLDALAQCLGCLTGYMASDPITLPLFYPWRFLKALVIFVGYSETDYSTEILTFFECHLLAHPLTIIPRNIVSNVLLTKI